MIEPERIAPLNSREIVRGDYVLYWMQQSQRARWNHALEYAVARANKLGQPLLVCFGLTEAFPEANLRHYTFMLEGLREVGLALHRRGIAFTVQRGDPAEVALRLGRRASLIVCDRGYLALQKAWRQQLAGSARCAVVQVESDVVVPVNAASHKAEFAARTLRPKLRRLWPKYLREVRTVPVMSPGLSRVPPGLDWRNPEAILRRLRIDSRNRSELIARFRPPRNISRGGTSEAEKVFRRFCCRLLRTYKEHRNQPQTCSVSHMSKYLHFGQVSPLWLALEVRKHSEAGRINIDSYIDELLVRRELSINWVEFTPHYERYDALPRWARETLAKHARDRRPHLYSRAQLEAAETHDPYWNAAMNEMRYTGYMHNHMRMYWGKKILEWSPTPEEAHATALALNNKYFIDGRDPNSFANVAWIFGLHDRPWPERPIFGKVRYMNARGLERKCDIAAYLKRVERLMAKSP